MIALAVKKHWTLPKKNFARIKLLRKGLLIKPVNLTRGGTIAHFVDYVKFNKNYFKHMRKYLSAFKNKLFKINYRRPGTYGKKTRQWYLNHYKDKPWMIKGYRNGKYYNPYKQPWFKNKNQYHHNKFDNTKPLFRSNNSDKKPWYNNKPNYYQKSNKPHFDFKQKKDFSSNYGKKPYIQSQKFKSKYDPVNTTSTKRYFSTYRNPKNNYYNNKFHYNKKHPFNYKQKHKQIQMMAVNFAKVLQPPAPKKEPEKKKVVKKVLTKKQKKLLAFKKRLAALPLAKRSLRIKLIILRNKLATDSLTLKSKKKIYKLIRRFNFRNKKVPVKPLFNFDYKKFRFLNKGEAKYNASKDLEDISSIRRFKYVNTRVNNPVKKSRIKKTKATINKSKFGKPHFKRIKGWYDKRLYPPPFEFGKQFTGKKDRTRRRPTRIRLLRLKYFSQSESNKIFSCVVNNPPYPVPYTMFNTRLRLPRFLFLARKVASKTGYRLGYTLFKRNRKLGAVSRFAHWIRIVNKPNNAYVSVVQPDRVFMRKFYPKISKKSKRKLFRVKGNIRHFIIMSNRSGVFPSSIVKSMHKRVPKCMLKIKRAHRKTGRVITLITAGTSKTMKEKDRGTFAAAQDAGYAAAKFLHKRKIKKVAIDAFNQYHFRLKAVYKGLVSFKSNLKLTGFRSFPKLPHSKGLRKRKQRRT